MEGRTCKGGHGIEDVVARTREWGHHNQDRQAITAFPLFFPKARRWSQEHHSSQEHPGHPQPGHLPAWWPQPLAEGWEGAATAAEEAQSAAIYGRLSQPRSSFPIIP